MKWTPKNPYMVQCGGYVGYFKTAEIAGEEYKKSHIKKYGTEASFLK